MNTGATQAHQIYRLGLVNPRADIPVPAIDAKIAMKSLEASLDRRAPEGANPITADEIHLMAEMKLYQSDCADCRRRARHGSRSGASRCSPANSTGAELGIVLEGSISVHESMITGEPIPVQKVIGAKVTVGRWLVLARW